MRNPAVPESLEGWWILHRMFDFSARNWRKEKSKRRGIVQSEALDVFGTLATGEQSDFALAHLLGSKANLMLTHYAKTYDGLLSAQQAVDGLQLLEFCRPAGGFVSVLELGLYDATAKIHAELEQSKLKPHSDAWNEAFDQRLRTQAENPRNAERLRARIPQRPYVCFYPMNKRRGETTNWYALPYAERARLMVEHGKIGRTYHGLATQVISGAIGYDDWEWGVDLYADDPLVFKKLVYEMRFDETSAKYGEFGAFYSGRRLELSELGEFLSESS